MKSTTDETRPKTSISADWVLKRIQEQRDVRLRNAVIEGDLDFSKLDLPIQHIERTKLQKQMNLAEDVKRVQSSIHIKNSIIQEKLNFCNSIFIGSVSFKRVTFNKEARFDGATFSRDVWFNRAKFCNDADFDGATFGRDVWFDKAKFKGDGRFVGAIFSRQAWFFKAQFNKLAWFVGAIFSSFISFEEAIFSGDAGFYEAKFEGEFLTFKNATFLLAKSQEEACRKAKNVLAKAGRRKEEEYHFYREMEARRKQKGIFEISNYEPETHQNLKAENLCIAIRFLWYDIIEYAFVQNIFGYGVHPERLLASWIAIVFAFDFIYLHGKAITGTVDGLDYFKISFATALAPGYIATIINPGSGGYRLDPAYQLVAIIETIFGTFLWAGFIATFAKKYMR